jgi:hypothetical protein
MLRLAPAPEPRISFASAVRTLTQAIWRLLIDTVRLGLALGLLYLLAVALGVLR